MFFLFSPAGRIKIAMMLKVPIFCCLWLFAFSSGKNILRQDKVEIEYVDEKNVHVHYVTLTKVNATTNVLNVTVTLKTNLPENFKIVARGFKSINDNYRLQLFRYDTTLKEGLQQEVFDLQSLYLKYTQPPMIYPLPKATYHSVGWTPDYGKLMPNFPEGKWKFHVSYQFANGSRLLTLNWYCRILSA